MTAMFTVDVVVRLAGIKYNPALNGSMATLVRDTDHESRGRYAVKWQSQQKEGGDLR
jgi:hypothetical protein